MTVSYLKPLLNISGFSSVVDSLGVQVHKDYKEGKFNALICTGLSGVIIASAISYKCHIPIIIVRKGESTHSQEILEGYRPEYKKCAFIDDFISSGKTLKRILDNTENLLEIVQGYFYVDDRCYDTLKDYDISMINMFFPDLDFPIFSLDCYDLMTAEY